VTAKLHRLLIIVATAFVALVPAVGQDTKTARANHTSGSLSEIGYRHRALLLVLRSGVVSADQDDREIVDLALKAEPEAPKKHQAVYTVLAKKLNKYIRKYRSLSAAHELSDADCVILFNVVEYRKILDGSYAFGELFVIIKSAPDMERTPRVVWKSKRVSWVADAVDEFLRALKKSRGES